MNTEIEEIECPVCYEITRVYASICDNSHYLCMGCIERMACKVELYSTVVYVRCYYPEPVGTSCPVCRQGHFGMARGFGAIVPELVFGHLHVSPYHSTRLKKPIRFRGERYPTQAKALIAWRKAPWWTYVCVINPELSYYQKPGVPDAYVIELFRDQYTQCDLCSVVGVYQEIVDHFYLVHHGMDPGAMATRGSPRIAAHYNDIEIEEN